MTYLYLQSQGSQHSNFINVLVLIYSIHEDRLQRQQSHNIALRVKILQSFGKLQNRTIHFLLGQSFLVEYLEQVFLAIFKQFIREGLVAIPITHFQQVGMVEALDMLKVLLLGGNFLFNLFQIFDASQETDLIGIPFNDGDLLLFLLDSELMSEIDLYHINYILFISQIMQRKEQFLNMARLAEQMQRFDNMTTYLIQALNTSDAPITPDERNLLSVALKNSIISKRTAWRAVTAHKMREESKGSTLVDAITNYQTRIEKELMEDCLNKIDLINTNYLPRSSDEEGKMFFFKMLADYHRYIAQFHVEKKDHCFLAHKYYTDAKKVNQSMFKPLPPTNPLLLGIELNLAVLYHQIEGNVKEAVKIAEDAFNNAAEVLNDVNDDEYKDTTTVMQVLYDNLVVWRKEQQSMHK